MERSPELAEQIAIIEEIGKAVADGFDAGFNSRSVDYVNLLQIPVTFKDGSILLAKCRSLFRQKKMWKDRRALDCQICGLKIRTAYGLRMHLEQMHGG